MYSTISDHSPGYDFMVHIDIVLKYVVFYVVLIRHFYFKNNYTVGTVRLDQLNLNFYNQYQTDITCHLLQH